jgi:hypothetical protein
MNIVCYNSFLMEQRQYGFYFVGNLPHDSAAAEMAGMVGKLVGAEVGIIRPGEVPVTQPATVELQSGEEYPHQNLAKRINKSFGRYLQNHISGFWDIGGSSVAKGEKPDQWKEIGYWSEVIAEGLTPQEEEYISIALQAFPRDLSNLQIIRDDTLEYQVNAYKMPINTARFWEDALETPAAQDRREFSLNR